MKRLSFRFTACGLGSLDLCFWRRIPIFSDRNQFKVRCKCIEPQIYGTREISRMFLKQAEQMKQYTRAFILIQCEPMREKDVMEEIMKMDEVIEVHMITGDYDVIAVVQVKRHFLEADYDNVFNSAIAKIEGAKYVVDTNTIIGMASKTKIFDST